MPSHRLFTSLHRLAAFVSLGLGLVVTNGCDALNTTAPPATPVPDLPRHDETGSGVLGSTTLAWTTGRTLFGTAPENKWVIVRASGEWTAVDNPACGGQPSGLAVHHGSPAVRRLRS
jgi:hypothetical protein